MPTEQDRTPFLSQDQIDAIAPSDVADTVTRWVEDGVLPPFPEGQSHQAFVAASTAMHDALRALPMEEAVREHLLRLYFAMEQGTWGVAAAEGDECLRRGFAIPVWLRDLMAPADDRDGQGLTPTEWLTSGQLLRSALEDDDASSRPS